MIEQNTRNSIGLTHAENTRNMASSKVLDDIDRGILECAEKGEMHFDYALPFDVCDCEITYYTKLVKKAGYKVCYYDNFNNEFNQTFAGPMLRIYWNG